MFLFSRIVIIGVGLIGGSLGLAAKKRRLSPHVIGIDRNGQSLETALKRGVIDQGTTDLDEGINGKTGHPSPEHVLPDSGAFFPSSLPGAELIIVAAPVSFVVDLVQQAALAVRTGGMNYRNVLITDTGSTKKMICSQFDHIFLPNGCRFIGSHPIAGKEKNGAEHADADLFEGKLALITPSASARDRDIGLLIRFWRDLGSLTAILSPERHDQALARTSHLPHLLSALLADRLQLQDRPYTGSGFHSTTRLASGSPELWRDIVSQNKDAIIEAVKDYEQALRALREKIENGDWEAVAQILEHAKSNREMIAESVKAEPVKN